MICVFSIETSWSIKLENVEQAANSFDVFHCTQLYKMVFALQQWVGYWNSGAAITFLLCSPEIKFSGMRVVVFCVVFFCFFQWSLMSCKFYISEPQIANYFVSLYINIVNFSHMFCFMLSLMGEKKMDMITGNGLYRVQFTVFKQIKPWCSGRYFH